MRLTNWMRKSTKMTNKKLMMTKKTRDLARRSRSDHVCWIVKDILALYKKYKSLAYDVHNVIKIQLFSAFESLVDEMEVSASILDIHFSVNKSDEVRNADISLPSEVKFVLLEPIIFQTDRGVLFGNRWKPMLLTFQKRMNYFLDCIISLAWAIERTILFFLQIKYLMNRVIIEVNRIFFEDGSEMFPFRMTSYFFEPFFSLSKLTVKFDLSYDIFQEFIKFIVVVSIPEVSSRKSAIREGEIVK